MPNSAPNMVRRMVTTSHGVVIKSMSLKALTGVVLEVPNTAVSAWNGKRLVCFVRLSRSSSRIISGRPSSTRASPASWLSLDSARILMMPTCPRAVLVIAPPGMPEMPKTLAFGRHIVRCQDGGEWRSGRLCHHCPRSPLMPAIGEMRALMVWLISRKSVTALS